MGKLKTLARSSSGAMATVMDVVNAREPGITGGWASAHAVGDYLGFGD